MSHIYYVSDILKEVEIEFSTASSKYKAFNSAHEGWAIIKKELDELWEEVCKKGPGRDKDKMHKEAIQIATMAVRFIHDVILERNS